MRAQATRTARAKAAPVRSVEQLHTDLLNFLGATDHLPDVFLQHESLRQDIVAVMDDEMITALDSVLEKAMFNLEITADEIQSFAPVHELLKKLRELQKARLRDAIVAITTRGRS